MGVVETVFHEMGIIFSSQKNIYHSRSFIIGNGKLLFQIMNQEALNFVHQFSLNVIFITKNS